MPDPVLISPAELDALMKAGEKLVLIDTRDPQAYAEGHLPNAVNLREIFTFLATSTAEGLQELKQVFAEGFCMMLVPILMRKVGVRNILLMGVTVMAFRILGSAVFTDPIVVSCIKMLHAIEVPLFVLGIFRYLTLHFPSALSATHGSSTDSSR